MDTANLEQVLQEIGLTKNEARVYVALVALETSTAYQVAQHCEVKRPTVYITLEDLRIKGLVLKIPHAKKALFAARDISEYLHEQQEKIRAVEKIAPKLQQLRAGQRPNTYFFTGLRGMQEAIGHKIEQMRDKTFYSLYGNLAGCSKEVMDTYAAWDKQALAHDISFSILMQEKDSDAYYKSTIDLAKENPKALQIRFLKEYTFPSNTSLEIGEDFVRITDSKNLYATIIDDKNTADMFREMFKIAWTKGV